MQKVSRKVECPFQGSDIVRGHRNVEDVTLLQEIFRKGNLKHANTHKQQNNDYKIKINSYNNNDDTTAVIA